MRISALITRLWGDIAAQPVAVALLAATVVTLALLAAVGLVVLVRRIETRLRRRRRWSQPRISAAMTGADWAAFDRAVAGVPQPPDLGDSP